MTSSRRAGFPLAAVLLLLLGCVPSLNPLYTDQTLREDDRMLGEWRQVIDGEEDEEPTTEWTVVKTGANAYRLTIVPDEYEAEDFPGQGQGKPPDAADLELRLVQLGAKTFADLMPVRPQVRNDMYQFHLLRSHTMWKIEIEDAKLSLWSLDPDWLEERLERGEAKIDHAVVDEEVVLTAETAELQALFAGLPDQAYLDPLVFVRPARSHW